jgi:serine/threonine-protein kinase
MGVVYLARSEGAAGFVKPVVVKIIHPELARNRDYMGLFIREARILASLKHAGIVDVTEFIEEQGGYYIMVLEYVHGFQLGEWLSFLRHLGRKIPVNLAIHIMINVLESLYYAHTVADSDGKPMEIVHRDVSPSNIMLDTDGGIKLVDFGIARMTRADASQGYVTTGTDTFRGKLSYSAPELFTTGQPSVKSDIYACGVTLHELLVGKNEFASSDTGQTIHRVINHAPSPIRFSRESAPPGIDNVLQKAFAKNPDDRYDAAIEFATALRSLQPHEPIVNKMALAELLNRDFGEEMADFLGVESLASRDRAWRLPSQQPAPPHHGPKDESEDDTTLTHIETPPPGDAGYREQLQPAAADGRVVALKFRHILAVVMLLLILGGIAVYFAFRPQEQQSEKYLLVQSPSGIPQEPVASRTPVDQLDAPAEEEAPAADDATGTRSAETKPAAEGKAQPRSTKRKARTGEKRIEQLTNAFKKRQGQVRGCFSRHVTDLKGKPKIFLTFTVQQSGKVEKVRLSPQDLTPTVLGKCLLDVARGTSFPKQEGRISFRIPITAWYGK